MATTDTAPVVANRCSKANNKDAASFLLTSEIYESSQQINPAVWNELCDADPYMDIRLLRAVEQSMQADAKFRYVLLRDINENTAACACLCTYSVDCSVLVSDGPVGKFVKTLKQLRPSLTRYKVLFCGMPFASGQSHLRISPNANHVEVIKALDKIMQCIARQDRASCIVLKEFNDAESQLVYSAIDLGYLRADSLPMNQVNVQHADFDAFVNDLPNRRRRKINKSRKKFSDGGLRFDWLTDADEVERLFTSDVHQMYTEMVRRSDTKLELLPREFFPAMVRELPDRCSLCVAKENDTVLAFVLCLETDDEFSPLFAGYSFERNREFDLYFNLMYVAAAKGMATNKKRIKLGQNADYCKNVKFGGYQTARSFYIKGVGTIMSTLIRLLSAQLFPDRRLNTAQLDVSKSPN